MHTKKVDNMKKKMQLRKKKHFAFLFQKSIEDINDDVTEKMDVDEFLKHLDKN